jgi:hypothetical protein
MNNIIRFLAIWSKRYALRLSLKNPAPDSIPLTGQEVKQRYYYLTYLRSNDRDGPITITPSDIVKNGVVGYMLLRRIGESVRRIPICIPNKYLSFHTLSISAFDKEYETTYRNPLQFVVERYFRIGRIRLILHRIIYWLFSWTSQNRKRRMRILKYIIEETINDTSFRTSPTEIAIALHGDHIAIHPNWGKLTEYYHLCLESLVDNGDVSGDSGLSYRITPKSINTLDVFEEEERRHQEQRRLQFLVAIILLVNASMGVVSYLS